MKEILKPTLFVTFPRSGHHFLIDCLLTYFTGEVFHRKDMRKEDFKNLQETEDFKYCEYYNHCKKVFCTGHKNIAQKNHDFNLKLSKGYNCKYVIQYRDKIPALRSYYLLRKSLNYTRGSFEDFLNGKWSKFYDRWVQKWVEKPPEDSFVLSYRDLITDKKTELRSLIVYLTGEVDEEAFKFMLKHQPIKKRDTKKMLEESV